MITALLIYVENGKARCFARPATNEKPWMHTGNSLENFRIGQLPFILSRVPGAAGQGLVDVTVPVEQFKKLRDASLPPLREVIFAIKASNPSRRTRWLQARLNVSGNDGLPFLIWDVLTYPDRSSILVPHRETTKDATTTE